MKENISVIEQLAQKQQECEKQIAELEAQALAEFISDVEALKSKHALLPPSLRQSIASSPTVVSALKAIIGGSQPAQAKRRGRPAGQRKAGPAQSRFTMSEKKMNEYLKFIGKEEKYQKDIQAHFGKTNNTSAALNFMAAKGKVKLVRREGVKKIWAKK